MLKAKVSPVAYPGVEALKTSILSEWDGILQETIRASVGNYRQRIKRLVEREGDHIEKK